LNEYTDSYLFNNQKLILNVFLVFHSELIIAVKFEDPLYQMPVQVNKNSNGNFLLACNFEDNYTCHCEHVYR